MVALANISDKSVHPHDQETKVVLLFFIFTCIPTQIQPCIIGHTAKSFAPSCSSYHSASGDISVIILTNLPEGLIIFMWNLRFWCKKFYVILWVNVLYHSV